MVFNIVSTEIFYSSSRELKTGKKLNRTPQTSKRKILRVTSLSKIKELFSLFFFSKKTKGYVLKNIFERHHSTETFGL